MSRFATLALALFVPAVLLTSGGFGTTGGPAKQPGGGMMMGPTKAVCVIQPLTGSKDQPKVAGVVYFTQKGDVVEITGKITGLKPGLHGFHVHEYGDLTSKDGLSTGGHFNPDKMPHAGPKAEKRHVGDLGNVEADATGTAVLKTTDKIIKLSGPHSIVGRGLIVHAKADDEKTQPTGDAGGRVGGGVIGVANVAPPKKKG